MVRVHAKTRREFDDLVDVDPPDDSANVYVDRRKFPRITFLSTFRILEVR